MTRQLTNRVKKEVYERACGDDNIPVCEKCKSQIHGLQYHHEPPKGMGGSKRHYTKENVFYWCEKCHIVKRHIKGEK